MDLRAVFEDFVTGIDNLKKLVKERKPNIYTTLSALRCVFSNFQPERKVQKSGNRLTVSQRVYEAVSET